MGVYAVACMNAILDAALGPSKAAHMPDEYRLRLYIGNPEGTGVEPTGGGYAPLVVSAVDWLAAVNGMIRAIDAYQLADPTDEWDDEVTHFALCHLDTDEKWFTGPLKDVLDVSGPGTGPRVRPAVFFADTATLDA